jgi:Dynamin family
MTSVITTVRYGSRPKAIVRRRGSGLGTEVPLAQVAGYIAQASATRAEQQVVSAEVEVPAEILRLGFEFIDTPGVGSAIEINTATTRQFLPQADAVIFVTGFDSPLTQAEAGFLADAARHAVTVTPASSSEAAAEGCTACRQMEEALTSHLFAGQFRLATREDEQARHTRGGEFCPLHTWQYAAVASLLGISAGYAKLAAPVADALESLSSQDSTAADLAPGVAALTTEPGKCPVCAALADRERTAIADLLSQVPPVAAVPCLRHLALALSAGVEASVAQALLHALAAILRRDSEDMRAFALKREAYRSGLVTAEESRAHLDALRRLAGPPALTQPWTDQEAARG